jgi:hypothetical protein
LDRSGREAPDVIKFDRAGYDKHVVRFLERNLMAEHKLQVAALILWAFLAIIRRPAAPESRLQRFWFAYAFGLAFAQVRFTFGH